MAPLNQEGFLASELNEFMFAIRRSYAEWFALGEELNRFGQHTMLHLEVPQWDKRKILGASLFIPILSNFQGIFLVSERGMLAESQILLRSMMEAMFALCAVSEDEQLHIDYILDDERQRLKFINKIRTVKKHSPESTFHELQDPDIDKIEKDIKTQLARHNPRRINTEGLAKIAKLHDLYNTAYSYLSVCVHARVRALERYLGEHPDGSLILFKWGPNVEKIGESLAVACYCLLKAIEGIARMFGLEIQRKHEEYTARYKALFGTIQP